jgi:hypothetical protein
MKLSLLLGAQPTTAAVELQRQRIPELVEPVIHGSGASP